STPGFSSVPSANYANYLKPIEAPLVFNGFSETALKQFAPQFAAAGIVPVMGVGSVSDTKQPERLEPGSAVSAILVRGDMDIAATCTVTYMDAAHLLACGHPLMQFGSVNLPMTKAQAVASQLRCWRRSPWVIASAVSTTIHTACRIFAVCNLILTLSATAARRVWKVPGLT